MGINFAQARDIFFLAVEKPGGGERLAYLDEACGNDQELRDHLEVLLDAHAKTSCFLDQTAFMLPAKDQPLVERPGTQIGPYKLLQQIGEGGFGVVFLAEQERPVKRRVALKVIKPGMDSRQVITRFEAERQALALMDHPSIAKVYDAGATKNGRPYFVMELVQGVPITEYCDQCSLTTVDRLELFVAVCQAVQHAHQKGVIHRDIKPNNVLVAIQDGRPAPKIIDFGVAKAINQQLTEHTLLTAFAQIVGTPLYMSPEQAELSPLGVDTRSDIYSLGALLYELLTSVTPFDKERLHSASYDELRRIIREEEPPRPSARISTLAADQATVVAGRRRTDTRRLSQTIRGELDWIAMKCLEKDRNRRYESAGALARDVERFLHDEPVQACPPSVVYRLKKFVRRHKIAAAFILLLGTSTAALAVSNFQTRMSERVALTENAKARAVSGLLQGMLRSANPDEVKDADYPVWRLLDDFSASFGGGLADQPEVEAEIRATLGRAFWRLGLADKAEPHLARALELRRQVFGANHESVAEILVDTAWCRNEQARLVEAGEAAREALQIYRACGTTGSPFLQASAVLQRILISSLKLNEAEAITNDALAQARLSGKEFPELPVLLHGQADTYMQLGRFKEAEAVARQSVEMHRRLQGPGHPETAWGLLALGNALKLQERFADAETPLREALAIFRQRYRGKHHSLSSTLSSLREVLRARGDQAGLDTLANDEAEQEIRANIPEYNFRIADLLLSNDPTGAQKLEARRLVRRAIEAYGQTAVDSGDDLSGRLAAADGFVDVAERYAANPDFAQEIDEAYRRFTAELEGLLNSHRDSPHCQEEVGHRYRAWATAVLNRGSYLSQCEKAHRESIRIFEQLSSSDPSRPRFWFCLANSYAYLGDVYGRSGRSAESDAAFEQAMRIMDERSAEIAQLSTAGATMEVIGNYSLVAYYLVKAHRTEAAVAVTRKASLEVERTINHNLAADGGYYLALMQLQLGDTAGYRATCKQLVELPLGFLEGMTKSRPVWVPCLAADALADSSVLVRLGEEFAANNPLEEPHFALGLLGAAHYRAGQYERAGQCFRESIAIFPRGIRLSSDSINYHRLFLAMTNWQLGQHTEARQLLAETLPAVDEELRSPASSWNRRATLEILRSEAEALVATQEADIAAKSNHHAINVNENLETLEP